MEQKNKDVEQLLQPDSAMSRFLLVVATLLGKNRAITPRRLSEMLEGRCARGNNKKLLFSVIINRYNISNCLTSRIEKKLTLYHNSGTFSCG